MKIEQMEIMEIIDRWEAGIDHEPESEKLCRLIAKMDSAHFSDSFGLSFGGDGDNGETLAYIIDALIENKLIEIKIIEASNE